MTRPVRGLVSGSCAAAIAYATGASWYVTAAVGVVVGLIAWLVGIAR